MTDSTKRADLSKAAASFALHGLSADEAAAFDAHLATSEALRHEVSALRETAALLGLAVEPVTPPASLKAGILGQLDATPQLAAELAAEPMKALATEPSAASPAEQKARARWMSRPLTALAATAAVLALLVSGGVVATTIAQNAQQQRQAEALAAINAASDVQRAVVDIEGGSATLVWSHELERSALIVDGLAPLPVDRVFQLWYIDEAGARSAGTFTMPASGELRQVLDGPMQRGDVIGVTVEPRGGSPAPTTDPIIVIDSA